MRTMKKANRKLADRSGESLAETLVSVLIAALAMAMLAGAMLSSSGMIKKSRDKLDSYYKANEALVNRDETMGEVTMDDSTMVLTDDEGKEIDVPITLFKNAEFARTPVIAYQYDPG